jgi:hypothetical protein
MKKTTFVILLLVSLSLIFSIASFIIIITGNSDNIHVNFNHPTVTQVPTAIPTQTPISNTIAINYTKTSEESIGNNTKTVFNISVKYVSGNSSTLNYSQFILDLYVPRGGFLPVYPNIEYLALTVKPLESGSVEIGKSENTAIFQLSFEFPTYAPNMPNNQPYSSYNLEYSQAPFQIEWSTY